MRGKAFENVAERITPAYAGKRALKPPRMPHIRDHPRLCGEKSYTCFCGWYGYGSPPPMRGKVAAIGGIGAAVRITPAYAGKSLKRLRIDFKGMDHPRLCGEKLTA